MEGSNYAASAIIQTTNEATEKSLLNHRRRLADGRHLAVPSPRGAGFNNKYRLSTLQETEPHPRQDKGRMDIAVQERKDNRSFSIPRAGLTEKAERAVKPVGHVQGCWPVGKY